ncbi:beta family protein [Vibrio parahaemolyticus]|uniref:beta family protein n=1 Tax=Vibrio parahaemolyticus TaxID=670 RepID=UPI00084BB7AA|nr:beta family protein [Vibrio parahaemolyticus]HBC3531817.1 beta family protein [Vibrio vulnificus]MCG6464643.1 beta family protein [Vibrio parahaemolyticus]MCG6490122.1 beta family protein [Vibrio parahaemolyticus]MDF5205759.1 beta family protein [Vibrio parahaemolyticus]MDF5215679.1 beta family protein [Vibrio parahaemolyticus]
MNNYTPFLKFKVAEIGALKALEDNELSSITPFFDLATKNNITADDIENTITKGVRKYELNFKKANRFYMDDYDIDDSILIHGSIVYEFLITKFQEIDFIPVIGLDRTDARNKSVLSPLVLSDTVAIRFNQDDFLSYTIIEDEISDLIDAAKEKYTKFHLILDCRLCINSDPIELSNRLIQFIKLITKDHSFDKIIISGSSIQASIAEILPVSSEKTLSRVECKVFELVNKELPLVLEFGDYTVISPNYSDVNIPQAALRKVMTPKVIYSYENKHHFLRGSAIETHPRGTKQYNDMCKQLVAYTFFRGKGYSVGDKYLEEKSRSVGTDALPHTIGKYLINAHMSYMINDYRF